MQLSNTKVWITGASSGIGEAIARRCAAAGARLILSARDGARLEGLRRQLIDSGAVGSAVVAQPLDLTDREAIARTARSVIDREGRIDLLIHAAGVSQRATALETQDEVVRRIMETNFFGPVALTNALLPSMIEAGGARIVVITSVFGKFGAQERSAYAASKHALHGFFDSLRTELPADRVKITLAVPGAIATNISRNALTGDGQPRGSMDATIAAGMPADACARAVLKGALKGREELLIAFGPRLRFALLLKMVAPPLLTRILRRAPPT